jgi:hypothetical protein
MQADHPNTFCRATRPAKTITATATTPMAP